MAGPASLECAFFRRNLSFYSQKTEKEELKEKLKEAVRLGDADYARSLIEQGIDPKEIRLFGESTLLHSASIYGNISMIKLLLEIGLDTNASDMEKITPLHEAIIVWSPTCREAVQLLLDAGADINAISNFGTPLDLAISRGNIYLQKYLTERGAETEESLIAKKREQEGVSSAGGLQEKEICAICLEDLYEKDRMVISRCQHVFHRDCVLSWIQANKRVESVGCPLCRGAI